MKMNPFDAVTSMLDEIDAQLREKIGYELDSDATSDGMWLYQMFRKREMWVMKDPFNTMEFEFDHAKFTLLGLCNMFEMMFGKNAEMCFYKELTEQVEQMVVHEINRRLIPYVEVKAS